MRSQSKRTSVDFSHSKAYPNLDDAWFDGAESKNFSMKLFSNAKVPGQTFSMLIYSILSTERAKKVTLKSNATIYTYKAHKIYRIGELIAHGRDVQKDDK